MIFLISSLNTLSKRKILRLVKSKFSSRNLLFNKYALKAFQQVKLDRPVERGEIPVA